MRFILFYTCLLLFLGQVYAQNDETTKPYNLWDNHPAPNRGGDINIIKAGGYPYDEDWETRSYPIGNGYMGANIFGRTDIERIQITEKTLYNKGLYALGGLTNFAEIFLEINHKNPQNYRRILNLKKAIASVSYTVNKTEYSREYFMNYPENVLVIKLSANKKGKISFTLKPEIPYIKDSISRYMRTAKIKAKDDLIVLSGLDNYFSINYEAQIKIINDGGTLLTTNKDNKGSIKLSNANSAVIIIATGTNYKLSQDLFTVRRNDKKLNIKIKPHKHVSVLIKKAETIGYEQLRKNHLEDYQNLFSRVSIDFNSKIPENTTPSLLEAYKAGNKNTYLEELLFQYGRYLLISSSRKGTLPSGLQGAWSQYEVTPWTGGYWHNINIQMNYWGALSANLAETFTPYIEYHKAYLIKAQTLATRYIERKQPEKLSMESDGNGWTIGTAANPYKIRGPGGHSGPGTGGLTSKLFWEYYDFTRDSIFLSETGYPVILGMSKFLSKTLEPSDEGVLLVQNSSSPEQIHNGKFYITKGTTFDQGFVWENHNDLLKAAFVLKKENSFIELVKDQITKLDPILIGASGQIKEYREENFYGDIGEKDHRHVSHLCPLYPGTLVNSTTKEWMDAAIVSLNLRGNNTSGWGMAHRLNLRARTKDSEKSYAVLTKIIKEKTLPNLWTIHPPFQIDANLGYLSGVTEMLLQSHEGFIEPLPALPNEWRNGSYRGLVARGNFEVSTEWKNGRATLIKITSRIGGLCRIKYSGIENAQLTDSSGKYISYVEKNPDLISFQTKKGSVYLLRLKN